MKVIVKNPGAVPTLRDVPNTLEALQSVVDGYIEVVRLFTDAVVICNEEGRLRGLPFNCHILGISFVGPIMLVGTKGEEFTDFPGDIEETRKMFPTLWEGKS